MAERIFIKANKSGVWIHTFYWVIGLVAVISLSILGGLLIARGFNRPAQNTTSPSTQGDSSVTPLDIPAQPTTSSATSGIPSTTPVVNGSDSNSTAANDSASRPAIPPQSIGGNLPVVCIDPGHPSEVNRGTTVQNGLEEVLVTYDVALKLKAYLEHPSGDPDHPIARVVMTRDFRDGTGKIVTNRQRAEIANNAGAALLLRLHCDTGRGSGYTIYYPDQVGTAADGKTGPSQKVIDDSGKAAKAFDGGMNERYRDDPITLPDNGVKGDSATFIGGKQGALTGSVYSEVPALTVEMVFLSNRSDAKMIGSDRGQQMMAEALGLGVIHALAALGHH